jgi:sporulation protein YtfJ
MPLSEHPIQGLMKTAMENIKGMIDVNTIVGDPVETPDGSVILPISNIGIGFAAGGSDFTTGQQKEVKDAHNSLVEMPFGGGSGGGLSITPVAFLVVGKDGVNLLSLDRRAHVIDRIFDAAPQLMDKLQSMMNGAGGGKSDHQNDVKYDRNRNETNNIQ